MSHTDIRKPPSALAKRMPRAIEPPRMENLLALLPAIDVGPRGRIIQFMAARAGEGTSTVARQFAMVAACAAARRVLLVQDECDGGAGAPGLLDLHVRGLPLADGFVPLGDGHCVLAHLREAGDTAMEWPGLVGQRCLWDELTKTFEVIVIDSPALARSHLGLLTAPMADRVIMVVEAETTRAPVALHLLDTLRRAQAPISGAILTKRRHHIPRVLYRMMFGR